MTAKGIKSIYISACQDDCYSDESLNTIQEGRDLFETQAYRPSRGDPVTLSMMSWLCKSLVCVTG